MTSPDPRWGDVVRLQHQFMAAASCYELRIQAAIDAIVAAIAGGRSTEPDDLRRAADSAERRERNRRRLLRLHVYTPTVEELRCACDWNRDNVEVARDSVRRAKAMLGDLDSAIVVAIGEGETAAEVAKATGLSVAGVRQRACRARARVRELLVA